MKMFDLRKKDCANTFHSRSDGVRNVQFSPFNVYQFAASFDNGNVQVKCFEVISLNVKC